MDNRYDHDDAGKDFDEIWKPLLYTDGALDIKKIKVEMTDLIFVYTQIARVYGVLTGGILSKETYYADVIIGLHNDEIQKAYEEGHTEGIKDSEGYCSAKDAMIRELDSNDIQFNAIIESVEIATRGGQVSDFMESFPVVLGVVTLRSRAEKAEAEVAALRNRLQLRYDTVEGTPTGYGEDEIDRLQAELSALKERMTVDKIEKVITPALSKMVMAALSHSATQTNHAHEVSRAVISHLKGEEK